MFIHKSKYSKIILNYFKIQDKNQDNMLKLYIIRLSRFKE